MPRKNMGLGYALTRYHRIGRPDDPVRVERDRPLECALCHADKTVGQLVGTMEHWWGRRYDRAMLQVLYGSLDARPLQATLTRGKPHEQAVAIATLGAAHATDAVAPIARQLVNPFPLVRYYARRALEALRGSRLRRRSRSAGHGDRRGRAGLRSRRVPATRPPADHSAPAERRSDED